MAEAENPEHATGPLAEYLDIIERDLDRTFPHNDRFSSKGGEAQQELRKVLRALAMANKELGYCQVRCDPLPCLLRYMTRFGVATGDGHDCGHLVDEYAHRARVLVNDGPAGPGLRGTLFVHDSRSPLGWLIRGGCLQYLSGVFDSGLGEIQVCGQVLQSLMATHVPLVHAKFKEEMLDPVLYMVDWFMVSCCSSLELLRGLNFYQFAQLP